MRAILLSAYVLSVVLIGCGPKKTAANQGLGPTDQIESRPLTELTANDQAPLQSPVAPMPVVQQVKPNPAAAPAAPAATPTPPAPPQTPAPRTVTVQKGDTLWSLAKMYLGDGRRWREIVAVNPGLDPKSLKVGQKIILPDE